MPKSCPVGEFECVTCKQRRPYYYRACPWSVASAPRDQCYECWIERQHVIQRPERKRTPTFAEVIECKAACMTHAETADHYGVTRQTVDNVISRESKKAK